MKKQMFARLAVVQAAALGLVATAHAELPPAATGAIDTAGTDLETAIGLVIGAMVVVWGLRKLGQKMGWL